MNEMTIAEYSATESALSELRSRLSGVVYDVRTTVGMEMARTDRAEVRGLRTSLEAKRIEIKAPALDRCRLIDAEAKRITNALRELEGPIDAQIKAEEQRKEAEKAAKAESERQRIAAIRSRIDAMRDIVASYVGKRALEIEAAATMVESIDTSIGFDELASESEVVKGATLAKLREMHCATIAMEAEQERLAEQRKELARLELEAAERRAAERQAQDAEAARIKAEQEAEKAKLRAEREEFERERAAAWERAEAESIEAERKAATERAEHERVAREAREAEEQRLAVERAELAKRQAEIDARERAEREKADAEKRERQRRAAIAALVPPSAHQITALVADHYALGDYDTAAAWLYETNFPEIEIQLAA